MKKIMVVLAFGSVLFAQDAATKRIELDKTDSAKILEDEGDMVRVRGFVESTRTNATGIHFLEFKDSEFICVTFGRYVSDFPEGPPAEIYREKWIEVTGEIQKYRGNPQIRLESPDQVRILDAPAPVEPVEKPEPEVKEVAGVDPAPSETDPEPKPPGGSGGRVLEVVNGVEALDWRKYFPE